MATIIYAGAQSMYTRLHDNWSTGRLCFFADHKLMSVPIRGRNNDCVLVPLQQQVEALSLSKGKGVCRFGLKEFTPETIQGCCHDDRKVVDTHRSATDYAEHRCCFWPLPRWILPRTLFTMAPDAG